ncbi:hypothetical protein CR513_48403, partial [Mucuna pruriens]
MTPFVLYGLEAHKGMHHRKTQHAWNNIMRKGLWSLSELQGLAQEPSQINGTSMGHDPILGPRSIRL